MKATFNKIIPGKGIAKFYPHGKLGIPIIERKLPVWYQLQYVDLIQKWDIYSQTIFSRKGMRIILFQ